VFCFLVAWASILSVWQPHPLSDDIFSEQNSAGIYQGMFPWSQFSYPLALAVYHTPIDQVSIDQYLAHGKAAFTITFAGANQTEIKATYSFLAYIMGPSPLNYQIDSIFSNSDSFFVAIILFFAIMNFAAALIGIALAKILVVLVRRRRPSSTAQQAT
jgi:hypothetical protein